jgi:uncharacterized membrane protein (DUF106 family)
VVQVVLLEGAEMEDSGCGAAIEPEKVTRYQVNFEEYKPARKKFSKQANSEALQHLDPANLDLETTQILLEDRFDTGG